MLSVSLCAALCRSLCVYVLFQENIELLSCTTLVSVCQVERSPSMVQIVNVKFQTLVQDVCALLEEPPWDLWHEIKHTCTDECALLIVAVRGEWHDKVTYAEEKEPSASLFA